LKPDNRFVNKLEVIQYVNSLAPEHLMYALNYEHRTNAANELDSVAQSSAYQTTF